MTPVALDLRRLCFVVGRLVLLKVDDGGGEGEGSWVDRKCVKVDVDEMEVSRRRMLFCRPVHGEIVSRAA